MKEFAFAYYKLLLQRGWVRRLFIDKPSPPVVGVRPVKEFLLQTKLYWWLN